MTDQSTYAAYKSALIEWMRLNLDEPGKTQRALADEMGVSDPVVSKILKGEREIAAAELPAMARYFGNAPPAVPVSRLVADNQPPSPANAISEAPDFLRFFPAAESMEILAAKPGPDSNMQVSREPFDRVPRPWFLRNSREGFGLIISSDVMSPIYEIGDTVIVNPLLAPRTGRTALYTTKAVSRSFKAIIARHLGETEENWESDRINPQQGAPKQITLSKSIWANAYPIVAKYSG
ncbi:helix-turn-helix domain-containing protein [Methylocella tundrae]|nr:helix-turn-helix transcriptional regulator [Methylocella tundrae]